MASTDDIGVFDYDVFISYSHEDKQWVHEFLVPNLEKHQIRVYTDASFPPGFASDANMEDAVRRSRHVILVLSKHWLASHWTSFEAALARGRDPAGQRGTIIPVVLTPCDVPDHLQILTRVELDDPLRRDFEISRLIDAILTGRPDSLTLRSEMAGDAVPGDVAVNALQDIVEMLQDERVRTALAMFRGHFQSACERIREVADLKDVHDQLHQLQLLCHDHIARQIAGFPGDADAREDLQLHADNLREIVSDIRRLVARTTFLTFDLTWVAELEGAQKKVAAAIAGDDSALLRRGVDIIDRVLANQPVFIDGRLTAAAAGLRMPELIEAMGIVCRHARDGTDPMQADRLEKGIQAMKQVAANVAALVIDHDRWQSADVVLRRVESNLRNNLEDLLDAWPYITARISVLRRSGEEHEQLERTRTRVDDAIQQNDSGAMRSCFRLYRSQAVRRFFAVDKTLKSQCNELRNVAEPLAMISRFLP